MPLIGSVTAACPACIACVRGVMPRTPVPGSAFELWHDAQRIALPSVSAVASRPDGLKPFADRPVA